MPSSRIVSYGGRGRGEPFDRLGLLAGVILGCIGCGGRTGLEGIVAALTSRGVEKDAGEDGPACADVCIQGESRCEEGGVAHCEPGASGCTDWRISSVCGMIKSARLRTVRRHVLVAREPLSPAARASVLRPCGPCAFVYGDGHFPETDPSLGTGTGTDGAQVEICKDRACTHAVTTFLASGMSGSPAAALASGVYYWRLRGTANGVLVGEASPVWEFTVGVERAR